MASIKHLHLPSINKTLSNNQDVSVQVHNNFFAGLNWKKLSSSALLPLLSVALTVAVLSIAEQALAVQKGNRGPEVRSIQRCLKKIGYYNGPVNGNFGELTEQAVTKFQRANRISAIGVVGPQTQRALQSRCESRIQRSNTASGVLRRGSSGSAVRKLQQDLRQLGYFNGQTTSTYGSQTEEAVLRFQQDNGMRPDGIVGARTKEEIRISLNRRDNPPVGVNPPIYNDSFNGEGGGSEIRRGDSGQQVRALQQDLQQLGYFNNTITGTYGPITESAVRGFQQNYGLFASGVADSETLNAISSVLARTNPSAPNDFGCSVNSGDICPGETSQRVATLQQRLQDLGFFRGNTTGYYGPATRESVTQFQRFYNLQTTGFVDSPTLQALRLNNLDNPIASNSNRENRYVVVVPVRSGDTLNRVRQYIPSAFEADSRLGAYVNAGQFPNRDEAQRQSDFLRSQGLDARVEYF